MSDLKVEQEKLELGIKTYVDNWFDGLIKSWKDAANKRALRSSYDYVAKQAVKANEEKQANEANKQPDTEALRLQNVMPMLLNIANLLDETIENTDPDDDIAFGKISDVVELIKNIADDNSMLIRN